MGGYRQGSEASMTVHSLSLSTACPSPPTHTHPSHRETREGGPGCRDITPQIVAAHIKALWHMAGAIREQGRQQDAHARHAAHAIARPQATPPGALPQGQLQGIRRPPARLLTPPTFGQPCALYPTLSALRVEYCGGRSPVRAQFDRYRSCRAGMRHALLGMGGGRDGRDLPVRLWAADPP